MEWFFYVLALFIFFIMEVTLFDEEPVDACNKKERSFHIKIASYYLLMILSFNIGLFLLRLKRTDALSFIELVRAEYIDFILNYLLFAALMFMPMWFISVVISGIVDYVRKMKYYEEKIEELENELRKCRKM